jgi:hypothetical protein
LGDDWWQWVISIPASTNPLLDETGANCGVGQHGALWFLAGNFGRTTTRTCSMPEGKALFFPIINSIQADTPYMCGQGKSMTVKELRAVAAAFIDGATSTSLSAEVDNEQVHFQRLRSEVFNITVPAGNIFDGLCGGFPAGTYSPAIDDGYYVYLKPLKAGNHTVHFHSENTSNSFFLDVTYYLTVIPAREEHD